ncbi:MAG: MFS transporter [Spirochaetales bacterium]|nr:MFS transporter [Spirochaetales bacterium]
MGDIFGGGAFLIIGMLFLFFLTEVVGLSPGMASLVFLIGKGWDAISDPLMGYISDRTKSPFGRRRVYFLAGIIPIAASFIIMWLHLETTSQWALFAYYSFAYVLFSTVFTMVMIPFAAINAEMSPDYKVRARLSGARIIFSGFAALLGGTLPKIIINNYPDSTPTGYIVMAVCFGLFFALPFIGVFFGTWELPRKEEEKSDSSLSVFREFFSIMKNKSFRIHMGMYIFAYTAMDILMALFAYYITYYIGRPGAYSIAMGALLLTQIIMMPVYVTIGNRKGKGFAYKMGMGIWFTGMLLTLTLSSASPLVWIAAVCAFIGMGTSAAVLIPWAILPSVIDVDELITGEMRSGIYSGAMTLSRKLIQGLIAMPLIGVTLQAIGFVSNQTQGPEVLRGMQIFFTAGPCILILTGIIIGIKFKITPETHKILSDELSRLKEGGTKADATPETIKICEELTGMPYERLYSKQTE